MPIISPKTGKLIEVGGEEFSNLLKDPKYRDFLTDPEKVEIPKGRVETSGPPPIKLPPLRLPTINTAPKTPDPSLESVPMPTNVHLSDILSMPFLDLPTLEETLKKTTQPSKREKLEKMIQNKLYEEGRGIKTRGWIGRSPTRGKERHQLKAECGDKCFLLPESEKFPICASPRITGGHSQCKLDCGGAQAAYIRAQQWKYPEVAEKAKIILEKCNKEGLKHFLPSEK